MSFLILQKNKRTKNPRQRFGSNLALWLHSNYSLKTFNGSTVSQINDLSGNGKYAAQSTASKQPLFVPNSYAGNPSLYFDNTYSQNIGVPTFFVGGIQTYVCVIKSPTSDTGKLFGTGGYNEKGWQIAYSGGSLWSLQYSKAGSVASTTFSRAIPSGEFHFALVMDNVNLKAKMYINGQQAETTKTLSWAFLEHTGTIRIFSDYYQGATRTGSLYNLFVVNRELTQSEIIRDYNEWMRYKP